MQKVINYTPIPIGTTDHTVKPVEKSDYSVFPGLFIIGVLLAGLAFWSFSTYAPAIAAEPVPASDYNQRIGYVEETDVPLELYQGAPVEQDTLPTPTLITPTEPPAVVTGVPVTPAPVVVATVDPAAIVAQAQAEAEAARLRADAEAYAKNIRDETAKRSQATAWGWFWLGLAFSALGVTLVAATLGTVDKWRTHWRKAAQKPVDDHRTAQDEPENEGDTSGLPKIPEKWYELINWSTGVCPNKEASVGILGSAAEYAKFIFLMEKHGMVKYVQGTGYVVTDLFREIAGNGK